MDVPIGELLRILEARNSLQDDTIFTIPKETMMEYYKLFEPPTAEELSYTMRYTI
jgi:hypothetical protein